MTDSHTDQLNKKKIYTIVFAQFRDADGQDVHAYISVRLDKFDEFIKLYKSGKPFVVSDYGMIIEAGEGKNPSPELMQRMTEEYGFDHQDPLIMLNDD